MYRTLRYRAAKAFARGCFSCSLEDYIAVKPKYAVYVPHTAGRYQTKRFRKAQCPIVERLTNSLMMHGRNNGKKLLAVRIVRHALEIVHLLADQNPIQASAFAFFYANPTSGYNILLAKSLRWVPLRSHPDFFYNCCFIICLRRIFLFSFLVLWREWPVLCYVCLRFHHSQLASPPFLSQVLVDAIINAGPREDATRIGSAGVVRRQVMHFLRPA